MSDIVTHIQDGNMDKCSFMQLSRVLNDLEAEFGTNLKVRFIASLELKHHHADVEKITISHFSDKDLEIEVTTSFTGIVGSAGLLPTHYTEYIQECIKLKDSSLSDFINIFHNRIMHLFRRIVENNNFSSAFSVANCTTHNNCLELIQVLIGISPLNSRDTMSNCLLNYVGSLLSNSRSEFFLKIILSNFFKHKIEIEQFVKESFELKDGQLSRIGKQHNMLGSDLYLGKYVYLNQSKVLIKVLDLNIKNYNKFVQDPTLKENLKYILSFYLGNYINYKICFLVIDYEKKTQIGYGIPRNLGVNMWCKN